MTERASVLDTIRKTIGKEMVVTAPEEVSRAFIRYFAQAVEDMNPLYLDEEYAKDTEYGGIIAPPTFVCESIQYMVGDLDEDGGADLRFRIGLPIGTEIRAANDYEFFEPVRPDDIITARWKVTDAYEKNGTSGKLYFLAYDITYTNQRDQLLAINHEWLVLMAKEDS